MLIRINEDRMGNVTAYPVNKRIRQAIIKDALSNGAPDTFNASLFMQEAHIEEVVETLGKRATFFSRCTRRREVNDNAKIRINLLDFRQMVGYSAG